MSGKQTEREFHISRCERWAHLTYSQKIDQRERAKVEARNRLKPGDKLRISRCGGIRTTITFVGWDGFWIMSRTLDNVSPLSVLKVNGEFVSFGE